MAMHSQNMGITGPYLSVFGRFSRSSTSGCLFQILLKKAIRLGRKPCTIYCSARINLRQSDLWGGGGDLQEENMSGDEVDVFFL